MYLSIIAGLFDCDAVANRHLLQTLANLDPVIMFMALCLLTLKENRGHFIRNKIKQTFRTCSDASSNV